jgi:hypothetical protein
MIASGAGMGVARAAPRRPVRMSFGLWMALARAAPIGPPDRGLDTSRNSHEHLFTLSATNCGG